MTTPEPYFLDLLRRIAEGDIGSKLELHKAKLSLCKEYGLDEVPSDSEILRRVQDRTQDKVRDVLLVKRVRSASGVAVVSVMTSPHPCPHGKCIYCPGGPDAGTPQSYTGREPASMRARQFNYEPLEQTLARLEQLRAMGHSTAKIELVILGGTFTNLDKDYREWFVKKCLDAMNEMVSSSLKEAQACNETAKSRCVGLTMETRPDCFRNPDVEHSMELGVTRVELGVQNLNDEILHLAGRGHTVEHVREATASAKDAGLKVCYHMMPGLPGSDRVLDLASFRRAFNEDGFKPDMLKIYPTVVLSGTQLHELWRHGEYSPLSTEEAVELIVEIKRIVPTWVRIQRIQREIETSSVKAGLDKGHLRNLALDALAEVGEKCRCIRCREVGLNRHALEPCSVIMRRTDYQASGGTETLLSLEDAKGETLVGYLRMRSCENGEFLRELKVFGEVVAFGEPPEKRWQHQGYGRKLVGECERIAVEERDAVDLKVTSGVGARDYYRRLGYRLKEPYMVKTFRGF